MILCWDEMKGRDSCSGNGPRQRHNPQPALLCVADRAGRVAVSRAQIWAPHTLVLPQSVCVWPRADSGLLRLRLSRRGAQWDADKYWLVHSVPPSACVSSVKQSMVLLQDGREL